MHLSWSTVGAALLATTHSAVAAPHSLRTAPEGTILTTFWDPRFPPKTNTEGETITPACKTSDHLNLESGQSLECCLHNCMTYSDHTINDTKSFCAVICQKSLTGESPIYDTQGEGLEGREDVQQSRTDNWTSSPVSNSDSKNEIAPEELQNGVLSKKRDDSLAGFEQVDAIDGLTDPTRALLLLPDQKAMAFCNNKCRNAMPSMPCKFKCYAEEEEKAKHSQNPPKKDPPKQDPPKKEPPKTEDDGDDEYDDGGDDGGDDEYDDAYEEGYNDGVEDSGDFVVRRARRSLTEGL